MRTDCGRVVMRRYRMILLPALLLGGQVAAAWQTVLVDRVVALVNDEVITLSEIQKEGKPFIQRIREELGEDTRARQMQITQRQILDALILRRLQLQEAKKEKVVVEQSEVTAAVEQIKKENGLTTSAQFTEARAPKPVSRSASACSSKSSGNAWMHIWLSSNRRPISRSASTSSSVQG